MFKLLQSFDCLRSAPDELGFRPPLYPRRREATLALDQRKLLKLYAEEPLMLVLFHDTMKDDAENDPVIGNFTAAAEELKVQRVPGKLGMLHLKDRAARAWASAKFDVKELPAIKVA